MGKKNVINVKDKGAIGDGFHDDTDEIQRAISEAVRLKVEDATVFFPPGIYLVSAKSNESYCLLAHSKLTFRSDPEKAIIRLAPFQRDFTRIFFGKKVSRVTFRNLIFDGNCGQQHIVEKWQQHAILLTKSEEALVEECVFHDLEGDGIYAHGGSERVTVKECQFTGRMRVCINFASTSNSLATRNEIFDSSGHCFKMEQNSGDPLAKDNEFSYNKVRNAGCVSISSGTNTVQGIRILRNDFRDSPTAIQFGKVRRCRVEQNYVSGAVAYAIGIRQSEDIIITDNVFESTAWRGGQFEGTIVVSCDGEDYQGKCRDIWVVDNVIRNNAISGCVLRDTKRFKIEGNRILGNGGRHLRSGVSLSKAVSGGAVMGNRIMNNVGAGIAIGKDCRQNKILGNRLIGNGTGIYQSRGAGAGNNAGTKIEPGKNKISGNKVGVHNESKNDFHAVGNEWGCVSGPGNPGCDTIQGPGKVIW